VTLNPITPTFSYSGTNLHLSTSGTDSGGVCNGTNGAANGSFQVINGDTLATNGALTAGSKNICVAGSEGGVAATGHAFTITVGNRIDAAAAFCANNGGGNGSAASPWHYNCIQAAANAAVAGDTVFLAAGYWSLNTDTDSTYVMIDKSINFVGAASGNTFDSWGHVNNASGAELCSGATVSITCIQETGTSYCGFNSTNPPCSLDTTPAGYIKFGSDTQGETNCVNLNISHIFFDGSQATDGGDYEGLLHLRFCNGVTIDDIRLLAYSQVPIGRELGTETQLYPFEVKNVTMKNSVFAEPLSSISNGTYGGAQLNQPTEGISYWGPWNIINNVFYQNEFNPIYTSDMIYTANVQYTYNDGHAFPPFFYGYGVAGDTLGGTIPNYGCESPGSGGVCNGSWHINSTNNLFYGPGITLPVGGSVNDPSTDGGLNDYNWTGNWLIADTSIIGACTANLNGGCDGVGMAINVAVDLNCNTSDNGTSFNITNNSIIATGASYIDGQGVGTVACHTGATRDTATTIPMLVYGLNAQKNYLQSPSNNYLTNANTISPLQQNNFCSGGVGTWSSGAACNTTGFNQAPTGVSFALGPLGLGGIVPINSPTATAQYGAVQWLAARCAAPCSSPPATPLWSDSRWSSNNGSFPNSAANSYIPPVSLSGVSHGDSVYLWVMDSANHISAAALQVVP
jgi:hypothetical protein